MKIRKSVTLLIHSIYGSDSSSGMRTLADGTGKCLVPEWLDAYRVKIIRAFFFTKRSATWMPTSMQAIFECYLPVSHSHL